MNNRNIGRIISISSKWVMAELYSNLGNYINTIDGIRFVGEISSYVCIEETNRKIEDLEEKIDDIERDIRNIEDNSKEMSRTLKNIRDIAKEINIEAEKISDILSRN